MRKTKLNKTAQIRATAFKGLWISNNIKKNKCNKTNVSTAFKGLWSSNNIKKINVIKQKEKKISKI